MFTNRQNMRMLYCHTYNFKGKKRNLELVQKSPNTLLHCATTMYVDILNSSPDTTR